MKKLQTLTTAKIAAILMLFWALTDNPYGYYHILRWVICGLSGYSVYLAYKNENKVWIWIFGIIAVLFNPIVPIYLDRESWSVIDVIVATVIFTSIFKMKVVS